MRINNYKIGLLVSVLTIKSLYIGALNCGFPLRSSNEVSEIYLSSIFDSHVPISGMKSMSSNSTEDVDISSQENRTVQEKKMFSLLTKAESLISYKQSIANEYLNQAIQIANKVDNYKGLSYAYYLRGRLNKYQSNIKKAYLDFENAMLYTDLIDGIEKDTLLGHIYLGLGSLFGENDMYNEAFECYTKVKNIALKYNDRDMLLSAEGGLIIIYSKTENSEMAIKLQKEFADSVVSRLHKRGFYLNIGDNYIIEGKPDSAILNFHKSLDLIPEDVDSLFLWTNWINLGIAYISKQELNRAVEFLNKAKNSTSKYLSSLAYCNIAKCKMELGDFKEAKDFLNIAEKQAMEINNYSNLSEILQNKINLFLWQKDWEKAYLTTIKLMESNDSLDNQKKLRELKQTQLKLEYKLRQKEKDYKQEKLILKNKNQRQKLTIVFLFIISISLAFIIMILMFKFKRLKRKTFETKLREANLIEDLESTNKKLVSSALESVQQKERNHQISVSLNKIKDHLQPEQRTELECVIKKLKIDPDKNLWNEFDHSFCKVKLTFYENLGKSHPDLTPQDLRLCALLSLNLNTKEIASITNLSPNSIRIFRSRIRNKLGLRNSKTNLFEYLSDF